MNWSLASSIQDNVPLRCQRCISHSECVPEAMLLAQGLSHGRERVDCVLKERLEFIRDQQNCVGKIMALGLTHVT